MLAGAKGLHTTINRLGERAGNAPLACVQTIITWEHEGKTFKTHGLDADQTEAAIKATIKMLNIIE